MVKMVQKRGFWIIYENCVLSFFWKWCKIEVLMVFEHSGKTTCLAKTWFSSYGQKCSQPIVNIS